jgi:hypothetical protein
VLGTENPGTARGLSNQRVEAALPILSLLLFVYSSIQSIIVTNARARPTSFARAPLDPSTKRKQTCPADQHLLHDSSFLTLPRLQLLDSTAVLSIEPAA